MLVPVSSTVVFLRREGEFPIIEEEAMFRSLVLPGELFDWGVLSRSVCTKTIRGVWTVLMINTHYAALTNRPQHTKIANVVYFPCRVEIVRERINTACRPYTKGCGFAV